jgi:hypothetical protein
MTMDSGGASGEVNSSQLLLRYVVQRLDGERVEPTTGRAAGAVRLHVLAELGGQVVEHAFGEHAARGVVGAEDEDVGGHGFSSKKNQRI